MLQTFDERNANLLVNVNGVLRRRDEPHVSAFDSVVQGGDAVWEGLRVYDGRVFRLMEHLARMRRSARALAFARCPRTTGSSRRFAGRWTRTTCGMRCTSA